MNINGNWMNFAYMDNPTLYTSAYLVASPQGYTKHYYAGSERIASAIGLGGLAIIDTPLELETYHHSWEDKSNTLKNIMKRIIKDCLGNDFYCKQTLEGLYHLTDPNTGTMDRYFYHPDHLGSSSWITDGSGNAIQHLHYLPFGEDWVDQCNSSWNTPYTFSGKEKDAETGYGYFGARYYDSGLSIWLSVDPMSDKYPHQTNYVYCSNNPVMIFDPNGADEYEINPEGHVVFKRQSEKHQLFVVDNQGNRILDENGKEISLTLKSKAIFDGLASTGKSSNYTNSNAEGGENSQNDMLKTFKFVADNTNVEWRVDRFNDDGNTKYSIGSIHDKKSSPTAWDMGHKSSSVVAFIHSHPNSGKGYDNNLYGMGWNTKNPNDPLVNYTNDVYNKTYELGYKNCLYYTYVPKSGNLFSVRSAQIPAFIRKISSYKDFMFGTINTR